MPTSLDEARDGLSFGPFHLLVRGRLLTRDGVTVELGARALDLLIALVSSPQEVIGKADLIARVWPDVLVEEGSLRFLMNTLRKALGDGKDGARYIATLPGRGYCFVAPVSQPADLRAPPPAGFPHANLPARPVAMVGRDEDAARLAAQLAASRLVTIVGSGGVGKTTLALAVAHQAAPAFDGAALFVDYGMIADPDLVAAALASMLGLAVGATDVRPNLLAYLRDRQVLLILDTCEHLIDAVAQLAAAIIESAPHVRILATSRESLRIDGERIYRLDALACPPDDPELTVEAALSYPAAALFVDRANASGSRLDLGAAEARVVGAICRKLDGVALAIELAARRVESCGLQQTAELLGQHIAFEWVGTRTAPPRQQTLQATLDWSFGLLTDQERRVLRRLSVFVGHFTLDAALEVIAGSALERPAVFAAIDSLVAKSMLATQPIGAKMRYRLLDTTRAYALQIEDDAAESAAVAARHAAYHQRWLGQFGTQWSSFSTGVERLPHFVALNNVRAALRWCFSPGGDAGIGAALAVEAAPVFLVMGLMSECHHWSEAALAALGDDESASLSAMRLHVAIGISGMYTHGDRDRTLQAFRRGLAIAETIGDARDQLRVLVELHMIHLRAGEFDTALHFARRSCAIACAEQDAATRAIGHFLLGNGLHFCGDLVGARTELETALQIEPRSGDPAPNYLGFEGKGLAGAILARNLWLQGNPSQAAALAQLTINDAAERDHSLTLCIALLGGVVISLWNGNLARAEEYLQWLIARAESYSLLPYVVVGRGFEGVVAIQRGDPATGMVSIAQSLERLHSVTYEIFTTSFEMALAHGLAITGRADEAIARIDGTIQKIEANGGSYQLPEVLRIKANLLASLPSPPEDAAEDCLQRSLALSRSQGARAWELRTATDLAALWIEAGRADEACSLLDPVVHQFADGMKTPDLRAAALLLERSR